VNANSLEQLNRIWHAEMVRLRRFQGMHLLSERCAHCQRVAPEKCDFVCDTLVPYEELPEQLQKNGVAFLDAILERLKSVKEKLSDPDFIDLASGVKDKIIRARKDGSHGPRETCPTCFALFPDVCPKLYLYMGVKFESFDSEIQQAALVEMRLFRKIIQR